MSHSAPTDSSAVLALVLDVALRSSPISKEHRRMVCRCIVHRALETLLHTRSRAQAAAVEQLLVMGAQAASG